MEVEYVLNTKTNRKIIVGGDRYNKLISEGYYVDNKKLYPPETKVEKKVEKKIREKSPPKRIVEKREKIGRPEFKKIESEMEYETLPPIRCQTCNYPTGMYAQTYQNLISRGEQPFDVFNQLNIKRECCRRTLAQPPHISMHKMPYAYEEYDLTEPLSKLSINPLLGKREEYVRVVEGNKPPMLKRKVYHDDGSISYENVIAKDLPTRKIPERDYYISFK